MKKVIEMLEEAMALIWNPPTLEIEKKFVNVSISDIIKEAIAELKAPPRWETPEQWEKRTGKAWPDDWATYVRLIFAKHGWDPYRYITAKSFQLSHPGTIVVIATEAGPPPDGWQPEEE
jgi:hypothetical protein